LVAAAAITLFVVTGIVVVSATGGPGDVHLDGQGDLASMADPGGSQEMGAESTPVGGTDFSFGISLCALHETTSPIVLDSVERDGTVGDPVEFLGAREHAWTAKEPPSGIIFVDGFPPPAVVAYPLVDIAGAVIRNSCGTDSLAQVIVGLRKTTPAGGGWAAVKIHYHVGSRKSTLLLQQRMVICGTTPTCYGINDPP
jgi:hypothetical protein